MMLSMCLPVSRLAGYAPALPTPFDENDKVGFAALSSLCDRQIRLGANALVVCGTTGEAPRLSRAEQEEIVRVAMGMARANSGYRNLICSSKHLELPAPAALLMILIAAAFTKEGHSFLGIGAMIAFHALFLVARLVLARFNERQAAIETARAAAQSGLWLVPAETVASAAPTSPAPPRDPRPTPASQIPYRHAA